MRKLSIGYLILLVSCRPDFGVDFIVHNQTSIPIDSVVISSLDSIATIRLYGITPGTEKSDFLRMNDIKPYDGSYVVQVYSGGIRRSEQIGYYTNGTPCEEQIDVIIENDTIMRGH